MCVVVVAICGVVIDYVDGVVGVSICCADDVVVFSVVVLPVVFVVCLW